MAEGGYDPMDATTEKTPLSPDTGDDDDDTDWDNTDLSQIPAPDFQPPDDHDSTQPFDPPRAASTPAGEQIPMVTRTQFPQEQHGPRIAETNFGGGDSQGSKRIDIQKEAGRQLTMSEQMAFREVRDDFKQADLTKIDVSYFYASRAGGDGRGGEVIEVKLRNKDTWYRLKTQSAGDTDKTLNQSLPPNIKKALGEPKPHSKDAVNKETAQTNAALQALQKQEETQRKALQEAEQQAAEAQRLHREMDAIWGRTKAATDRIQQLENTHGSLDKDAIQRLKDEKIKLEAFQQARTLQQDINKTIISKGETERRLGQLKGQKDAIQPLEELKQQAAELNKHITEDLPIIEDENTSPSEREAARKRLAVRTEELEEIEVRERQRPLLERVKEIFKKYGWTLQAVVLAVGVVLSALALAGLNGLKAGTKAVGQGLKTIGQKLGSLLPGLIGSIVSFIFKAAGQVLSFLGEHAWLLILAVVAFFMERLLKKRRKQ